MRIATLLLASLLLCVSAFCPRPAQNSPQSYLGFDRNDYPGDAALPVLRKTFTFAGYWLSPPPGIRNSSWTGKRAVLKGQGFGFLLLYRGRTSDQLHDMRQATRLGQLDARDAAAVARREGFAERSVIFLDLEEGGRLGESLHAYILEWAGELGKLGFSPGVYCSGEVVDEGDGVKIITADDIRAHMGSTPLVYWVFRDSCPPSPGCVDVKNPPSLSASGVSYAAVWQFVRSPREKDSAGNCKGYAPDEQCYATVDTAHRWNLDLNIASSVNPSAPQ
jgi:hypothetical protein